MKGRVAWSQVAPLVHQMADNIVDAIHESREGEYSIREEWVASVKRVALNRRAACKDAEQEIWEAARKYQKLMSTTGVFSEATADGDFEKQLKLSVQAHLGVCRHL